MTLKLTQNNPYIYYLVFDSIKKLKIELQAIRQACCLVLPSTTRPLLYIFHVRTTLVQNIHKTTCKQTTNKEKLLVFFSQNISGQKKIKGRPPFALLIMSIQQCTPRPTIILDCSQLLQSVSDSKQVIHGIDL